MIIWGVEISDDHNQGVMNPPVVMTWYATSNDLVIGSVFEKEMATGESYQNWLNHHAF